MIRVRGLCRLCVSHNVMTFRSASDIKMSKMMKKMIEKGPKKKWYKTPLVPVSTGNLEKKKISDGNHRRAIQVGKVLYNYISSIINTGELSSEIADMAVDIVKVKVIPDFSTINVYWSCSGSKMDDRLEVLLKQNEAKLRQILISYRVLGTVPAVNFVKDKSKVHYMEIEQLLKTADYGPGFEPTTLSTSVRPASGDDMLNDESISSQFSKMSLQFVDPSQYKVSQMDDEGNVTFSSDQSVSDLQQSRVSLSDFEQSALDEDVLQSLDFRSDIYGLHHDEIMQRLYQKKHKTKFRTLETEDDGEQPLPLQKSDYEKFTRTKFAKSSRKKLDHYTLVNEMRKTEDFVKEEVYDDNDDDFDDHEMQPKR